MTHPVPIEAIDAHTAVLGKTGTGKTYTARGLAEMLLDAGRQVVILDPTGAWWGLRSEYQIPIFGGEHGDIAISDATGEAVAAAIVDQRTSAIVDLKLLAKESGAAMRRFVTAFAKRLKARPSGAFYLIIDEADEFLPQNVGHGDTQLFGHLKWMVRRGRIDGFRVIMVTQRPAEIAKAVLTQIETLICHRVTAPQDRKAIEEWVRGHSDSGQAREVLNSLAGLDKGEAWIWAPEQGILERARIPANRSHDSSATPDADSGVIEQPELASIDMTAIRAALEPMKSESPRASSMATVDNRPWTLREMDTADIIDELERRDPEWLKSHDEFKAAVSDRDEWQAKAEHYRACIDNAVRALGFRDIEEIGRDLDDKRWSQGLKPARIPSEQPTQRATAIAPAQPKPQRAPVVSGAGQGVTVRETAIPASQQRVLDAIAWWAAVGISPVERNRASVIAGLSPKASTFGVYVSKLAQAGLVDTSTPGSVALTEAGREAANSPGNVNRRNVVDQARSMLKPAAANVLDAIVRRYPEWVDRGDLADEVGLSRTASTLGVYVSESSKLGFVETKPGKVRAAEWMMP